MKDHETFALITSKNFFSYEKEKDSKKYLSFFVAALPIKEYITQNLEHILTFNECLQDMLVMVYFHSSPCR